MSEKQLDAVADAMILWCATYLLQKRHKDAAAELLKLVPKERADEIMEQD